MRRRSTSGSSGTRRPPAEPLLDRILSVTTLPFSPLQVDDRRFLIQPGRFARLILFIELIGVSLLRVQPLARHGMTLFLLVLVLLCRSVLLCAFVVNSVRKLYMPLVNRAVAVLVVVAGILGLILIANEVF